MKGPWLASYVLLWVLVAVLAFAVIVLLRQIGVLHARLAPMGTHFGGEGLDVGTVAPNIGVSYTLRPLSVLVFTSPTCTICQELKPSLAALRRQYREIGIDTIDHEQQPAVFDAFKVRSTPYVVTVDRAGVVAGRGVANTLEQVEELVRESMLFQSSENVSS
jgi:thiol-disulfide isomerase/thioredoxin